ncbi:MAG TPA: phosphoglycerate dehydrogenase [Gammaproteobacteria bacterium]|nr:phosphoglycerate dehydrogenase [Gammaproteobacteria bacterium]
MYKILTLNNISNKGLDRLPKDKYQTSSDMKEPDAILVRSFKMHDMEIPSTVRAVGRAGAGVNNIPIDKFSKLGIPVFNTPGANANAVKELVIAGMLLAYRNICQAWQFTQGLQGDDKELNKLVEDGKKKFAGFELPGRTLGVVGLGAIGVLVANAARELGMRVIGYDPSITVQNAWKLSSAVEHAVNLDDVFTKSDFITFHVPLMDATKNLLNAKRLGLMKDGVVVLNFAREGIVDDEAVLAGIEQKKVYAYITDFPSNKLKNNARVITLPHLGASTEEAEENCAMMVADQVRDYLEHGNIRNSVNFPTVNLPRAGQQRLAIVNENRPDMVGQISHVLGQSNINIVHMVNESRGDLAYTMLDTDTPASKDSVKRIEAIKGVLAVRVI